MYCVEGIGGGDDGAEGNDTETHHREVNGVRREEENNIALFDSHVGERGGDSIDGFPKLFVGKVVAGGGVDEGSVAVMGAGGDKSGGI